MQVGIGELLCQLSRSWQLEMVAASSQGVILVPLIVFLLGLLILSGVVLIAGVGSDVVIALLPFVLEPPSGVHEKVAHCGRLKAQLMGN